MTLRGYTIRAAASIPAASPVESHVPHGDAAPDGQQTPRHVSATQLRACHLHHWQDAGRLAGSIAPSTSPRVPSTRRGFFLLRPPQGVFSAAARAPSPSPRGLCQSPDKHEPGVFARKQDPRENPRGLGPAPGRHAAKNTKDLQSQSCRHLGQAPVKEAGPLRVPALAGAGPS